MSIANRIAIVAGVVLLLGAALATFLPTSPEGATCGTWVAPEWTDEGTADLLDTAGPLADQSLDDELAAQGRSIVATAVASKRLCDDALSTRRTTSIVLLLLGVLVPAGVVFVGLGRYERSSS